MIPINVILMILGFVKNYIPGIAKKSGVSINLIEDMLSIFQKFIGSDSPDDSKVRDSLTLLLDKVKSDEIYKADLNTVVFKAINKNLINARKRDMGVRNGKSNNFRADLILFVSILTVTCSTMLLVYLRENIDGEMLLILSSLVGFCITIINDFTFFEFGRSNLQDALAFNKANILGDCIKELKGRSCSEQQEFVVLAQKLKTDTDFRFKTNQVFAACVEQNMQDARVRDLHIRSSGKTNVRANVIVYFSLIMLFATIIALLIYKSSMNAEVIVIMTSIVGFCIATIRQVSAFECGSTSTRDESSY